MNSDSQQHSSSKRKSQERSRSRSREKKNATDHRDKKVTKVSIPELNNRLISIRQFSQLQTERMNPETIQKGYDRYKKKWEAKQNIEFFNQFKGEVWMNEKYNPEFLDIQEKQKRDRIKRVSTQFILKYQTGFYDEINLQIKDAAYLTTQLQIGTTFQIQDDEQNGSNFLNNQTQQILLNNNFDVTKSPFFGFDSDSCTLFIRSLSKGISRYDIKQIVQKLQGFKSITMSDPQKKANFTRNCWIEFYNQQQCAKASLSMNGLIINNEPLNISKAYTKIKKIKILKNYPTSRMEIDINTLENLIKKFDLFGGVEQNELLNQQFKSLNFKFDILLLYLRRVHSFDYYTCTQYQNERILALKTGSIFLRTQANYEQLEGAQTVFKKIQLNSQSKLQALKEPWEYMSLVRQQIIKFIRQAEKIGKNQTRDIWKCLYCDKKFKTSEFLSKHIIARHQEIKVKKINAVMQQLYMKDPNKITSYTIRDDNKRKMFGGGFRRQKRKEVYHDFDEPGGETTTKAVVKSIVNFLDI